MNNDCFAYKGGECGALNECVCRKGSCRFYKTEAEHTKKRVKAEKRIRSLDLDILSHISATYYKSKL